MSGPATVGRWRPAWTHVVVVLWLAGLALVTLAPALSHGGSFGSFDLLSRFGVLRQAGLVVHNNQAGDQSDQIIPWATLVWEQVHHGHLPLWNPYEGLGMPLAFNWQSSVLSVPNLVGYLFPLRLMSTVQVVLTLVIAGTGVYVLGRTLRWTALASMFAATTFELSGPMVGWLGWPHAAVFAWSGWLFAAVLLVVRGRRPVRAVVLLALAVAATVYAGQAEVLTLLGLSVAVFALVLLLARRRTDHRSAVWRPVRDLVLGGAAGAALGAPLLLPGFQVIQLSERRATNDPGELVPGNPSLPADTLVHLFTQGFDGLPVAGSHWFGYVGGYSETAAVLGVLVVVLAVAAVGTLVRRPEVLGIAAVGLLSGAVAFVPPVTWVAAHLPVVGDLLWQRALLPFVFSLAVLAGFGMDALLRSSSRQRALGWTAGGLGAVAMLLVVLWVFGRGGLDPADLSIRSRSFIWPVVELVVGAAVVGSSLWISTRRGTDDRSTTRLVRGGCVAIVACTTAVLVTAGTPLWTSAPTPFASRPAARQLQHLVGSSLVGFGAPLCYYPPGLGVIPNAQLAYQFHELGIYDPMVPHEYFSSWHDETGVVPGNADDSAYCPVITTAAQARRYGVAFVLVKAGDPGPAGTRRVATIADSDVYRVPGTGAATVEAVHPDGSTGGPAEPVAVAHPDPATWNLVVRSPDPQRVVLHLADVPGWHATVDGRTVPLHRVDGLMLGLDVPAGAHTVRVTYWPGAFTAGVAMALVSLAGLVVASVVGWRRSRRRLSDPAHARPADDPGHR